MSNKTRKRIWPAALVMSLGIVGVLAAFLVLAANPVATNAHDGATGAAHCDDFPSDIAGNIAHEISGADHDCDNPPMPPANAAPMPVGSIAAVTLTTGASTTRDVTGNFSDADTDDTLTITAASSDTMVASISVVGNVVTVKAEGAGMATITVTASDGTDSATQTIAVSVTDAGPCDETDADGNVTLDRDACVFSSTTSASAAPELRLLIESLDDGMSVGSSIVLYLEDDYQEPDAISAGSVYIVATKAANAVAKRQTGNESRVYLTVAPRIKTGAYFDADKKDISIQVLVPDMCTNATDECEGPNGLNMHQQIEVVFESSAGIKNPSEEKAGGYHTGYTLLGPTGRVTESLAYDQLNNRERPGQDHPVGRGQQPRLRDDHNRLRLQQRHLRRGSRAGRRHPLPGMVEQHQLRGDAGHHPAPRTTATA